jgi:hypothetical protein
MGTTQRQRLEHSRLVERIVGNVAHRPSGPDLDALSRKAKPKVHEPKGATMKASRSNCATRAGVFLLAVLGCGRLAGAQDSHTYISGAIELSTFAVHSFETGGPGSTYFNTADDPTVVGVLVEGGSFVSRNIAVGPEIHIPLGRAGVTNTHGYFNPYTRLSQYQELSVLGTFHGYVPSSARVRAGLLAGAGIVFANSLDRTSTCNFDPSIPCSPFSPEQEKTRPLLGATVGGDVVIQTTRRLSIVPQFRLFWVNRDQDVTSGSAADHPFVILGIDRVSYRGGIGLRVTF